MAEQARPASPRRTTFLAVVPEGAAAASATTVLEGLRARLGDGAVRWVRPDSLHVTVAFLGALGESAATAAARRLAPAIAGCAPPTLRLAGAGRFPPRGAARVLWLGVEDEAGRLAAAAAACRAAAPPERAEHGTFVAHCTVGRARRWDGTAADAWELADVPAGPAWTPHHAVLLATVGAAQGSTYLPLARLAFGGHRG